MSTFHSRWLVPAATLLVLGGLWLAPISPLAISRADVALGQGDPVRAVRLYDQVARWTPVASVRARALDRGAAVYSTELNDAASARERLERLVDEIALDPADEARIRGRIGRLYLRERRPTKAAKSLLAAVDLDPDAVESPRRLVLAARALAEAGHPRKAAVVWERLGDAHTPWRSRSWLGLAELHLAAGDVIHALPLFEDVVAHGTPEEQSAARLGVSVCQERLGDLDEAVAALTEADLPDMVRRSRENALRARQAWIP